MTTLVNFVQNAYDGLTFTFISLFAVMNPLGLSPFFYTLTPELMLVQRTKLAWRVATYSFILLLVVYLIGSYILNFFGISLPALQITGGSLVFVSAWKLLNSPAISAEREKSIPRPATNDFPTNDLAFFPLTMPVTAGAGSMAVVLALAAQQSQANRHSSTLENLWASHIGSIIGILVVCVLVGICYNLSSELYKKLGKVGAEVLTRLSAFILIAVAVTITWNGIASLIHSL